MSNRLSQLLTTTAFVGIAAAAAQAGTLLTSNDGTIKSSLCVGFDCTTSESFGFDTIRLKENNLRIHFDDTSASAGFPNQDWRLEANSSSNGGGEYFRIVDATANRAVATFEANAPSNALVLDDRGRLGLGTANPVAKLQTTDGDTPTLRLEQNSSSGWSPQTWDLAGNETSFFIRDASNGSTLPFRIRPGASSNALLIDGDDDIGIGAGTNPSASLHVKRSDGTARVFVEEVSSTSSVRTMLELKNLGRPEIVLANTGTGGEWSFGAGTKFILKQGTVGSASSAKTKMLEIDDSGNATFTGTVTTGGTTCGGGCDRVFTEAAVIPQSSYATQMWSQGYLPHVGPTPEGTPLNVSQKLGGMLNALEHAHVFIDRQEAKIDRQEAEIAELRADRDTLTSRVEALEQLLLQHN